MAAGCLSLLLENGIRIPEQMSLIGFDDGHVARYIYPRLTTVRYPIQVMASEAVKLSLQLANGGVPDRKEHKLFMPMLIRRASVGAPAK